MISDECSFAMNGVVNTRNVRVYAPRGHPREFYYSRQTVLVWGGLCGNGLLFGPFFIDGPLTGIKYHALLVEEVFPELMRNFADQFRNEHFERLAWAQDEAPAHRFHMVRNLLDEMFENRVIGLGHQAEWPPRSPDLTPCDFFLWGYLKSKVFVSPPDSLDDLRQRIRTSFTNLRQKPYLIQRAMRSIERRVYLCTENEGPHVKGHT